MKRLHGAELKKLAEAVYERDGGHCVCCGRFVPEGMMSHHEPPKGRGGKDIMENLVTLCDKCHYERHNGKLRVVQSSCEQYLKRIYGGNKNGRIY